MEPGSRFRTVAAFLWIIRTGRDVMRRIINRKKIFDRIYGAGPGVFDCRSVGEDDFSDVFRYAS